jgi:hypothetical protein
VKRSDARVEPNAWMLANEFANVRLSIDEDGNDPRLRIEDLDTGATIRLDAFVLAAFTALTGDALAEHAQPDRAMQAALQTNPRKNEGAS